MPQWMWHQGKVAKLARLPIGDLSTWHLLCSCRTCRADRVMPVATLAEHGGADATLLALVPKLRCETCRRPPPSILLRNRYPTEAGGSPFVEAKLKGETGGAFMMAQADALRER